MALARTERNPGEHREHQSNDGGTEQILRDPRNEGRLGGKIAICLCPAGYRIAVDGREAGKNEHAAGGNDDPWLNAGRRSTVENAKSREHWKRSADDAEDADDDSAARGQLIGVRFRLRV